ncbi:hypothetical protein [Labrys monachus]|uniref:Uncharacterized membrane protein (DUF4010 family) n=1 Tax=Labrys monachus TaxID=217067 RepID=A0ABU0FQY4_9HYPH|nr:hypothetical protein [Labrys monachus]MDQ0396480.1 uncharacterized membrane protein (DUF4010 family) [Labrys monachus]
MKTSSSPRLDLVSRVTVHIFIGQLTIAAIMAASSPKGFMPTFSVLLAFFAFIQVLLALSGGRRPPAGSLTEWDGVSWLLLVATGCHLLCR